MNKEYMLRLIKERIAQLEKKYREYCNIDSGPSRTYSGSACMRSRVKKDISTLKLLECILFYCPDSMSVNNPDAEEAFDRLVEPRRLK